MGRKCLETLQASTKFGAAVLLAFLATSRPVVAQTAPDAHTEFLTASNEPGGRGGRLVLSLRAEPKTLNPLLAADAPSREVLAELEADLIHINRGSQLTE